MKPWKLQKFMGDVVYDLRNRNLLLIVIMLLVAIIAVPVLIKSSAKNSAPDSVGLTAQTAAQAAPEGQTAVLAYRPGVRNYKQRLRDMSAKDPFKQQYAAAAQTAPPLDQGTVTSGTTDTSQLPGSSTNGSGGSGNGNGGGSGRTKVKTETQTYVYETDVMVGEASGTLARANQVQQFQFLPGPERPVLVYMGTTSGGSQAIFLVSKDVTAVGGQGTCFPTADDCQLLGLNPGAGADLVFGPDGKTYHLQVVRIKRFTK